MSSVTSAATNVATTASINAAPTGLTGTTAERKTCGAFERSWPAFANALAPGMPRNVSDGSSTTIASHAPITSAIPIVAHVFQRRRSASRNSAAGMHAVSTSRITHDAPE